MHAESQLKDQIAIVTGGGRGIGAATAEALAAHGAKVLICGRTASELDEVVARGEGRIARLVLDLANPVSAHLLFDEAERLFGRAPSILVNNAGIGYAIDLLGISDEKLLVEWEQTQAINVRAPFLLAREMLKRFQALPRTGFGGSIVNLGSLGGIRSTDKFPGLSLYVTSKFAVAGLTEALAVEGRAFGVRVNAVAPGAVDTEMLRRAAPHLKTKTTPRDVANVILGLCDPAISGAVSGTTVEIHSNL